MINPGGFRAAVSSAITITLCVALTACGSGKINPEDRAAIRSARVGEPRRETVGGVYADATSAALTNTGMYFGFVGALETGLAAAGNTQAGVRRWKNVTAGLPARVNQRLRADLANAFAARHGVRFPTAGPVDAELKVNQITFGVDHLGRQQFGAVVSVDMSMDRTGEGDVWDFQDQAVAPIGASLEECQRNPQLYVRALDEAIRQLAAKAVAAY